MKLNKNILDSIAQFENIIGYRFNNKEYILEALTHSSYSNENKGYNFNERLEFLGDSILSIVISDYLFKKETELPEGELTKLRANIVCEESLSEVAISIKLGEYMLLGKGEEATGGRERISILADAFEAVIAAIYLDGGLREASKFILTYMKDIIWYKLIDEKGPDHNKKFVMQVGIDSKILGFGEGKSKKEAEQVAARKALDNIN